jgi:chemosensory pili system protein ChpA (sensor histidine kinase/response regulator)
MEIDPAMLGIFLEEFDSVRAQLEERLPRWLEDRDAGRALADIRRGFHTLKGSAAWSARVRSVTSAWASRTCSTAC